VRNPAWGKVSFFSAVLFLTLLADAILSYWIPNFLEGVYQNSAVAGLVISFSSLVGLLADLILPQVVKRVTVRKLIIIALVIALVFTVNLYLATLWPFVFLTLLVFQE